MQSIRDTLPFAAKPGGRHEATGFVLLLVAACGCGRQDVDRLARMGRTAAIKFQGARQRRRSVCRRVERDALGVADTLEGRVQTRLRWTALRVLRSSAAEGGVVELRGGVADQEQRNWAVRLAESTVGVERVTDNLVVGTP
jgi:hypothetical protein